MDKHNLGYVYADDATFRATLARDNIYFKQLITRLNLKQWTSDSLLIEYCES